MHIPGSVRFFSLLVFAAALVVWSPVSRADDEFSWRASRPLRLPARTSVPSGPTINGPTINGPAINGPAINGQPRAAPQLPGALTVQRLQHELRQAQATEEFWSQRLAGYSRQRFSDAAAVAIAYARLQQVAAERWVDDVEVTLRFLRRFHSR
jgi:hypothetical protein